MGRLRTRQFLLERRILRSTVTTWLAAKLGWPSHDWETVASHGTLDFVRRVKTEMAELDENSKGFLTAGAEYRVRRRDVLN